MAVYLITGGAGFIGSHLVETLVTQGETVRVLDNFSTGKEENLLFIDELAIPSNRFTLLKGDIRDFSTCQKACEHVDFVLHQAALGSVPRSVDDPLTTNDVNSNGTLNMLVAARDAKVKRFIYASSSSVYGDAVSTGLHGTAVPPKVESQIPNPQSPYAISKLTGEYYCRVFFTLYHLETVALRYFNVFGQRQDANSHYAAVIPKFITALIHDKAPTIYGDGEQSRDFTHVDNVVQANLNACHALSEAPGESLNVACGERTTLNALYSQLCAFMGKSVTPLYAPPRAGDVKHSLADINKAKEVITYAPPVTFSQGLKKTTEWFVRHASQGTL
jgi:nucleoside-diphosphate-sugar epimerase